MSKRHLFLCAVVGMALMIATGIPTKSQNSQTDIIAGRNVNMVSGTKLPHGDPWLQRQNEPSIAVSTRNPMHLLAGANDYRTVDIPLPEEELPGFEKTTAARDAWLGVFKSFDGGQSWISTLLPGYPQDISNEGYASPLKAYGAAADPVVRAGTNGLFYYCGIAFNRQERGLGAIFVARFIDNNNIENGDSIQYLDTMILDQGTPGQFIDKPWMAVDIPRSGAGTVPIDAPPAPVQHIPRGNVYVAYSVFLGKTDIIVRNKILFVRSTDCGLTWSKPVTVNESSHINQGATIAVAPNDGTVYVAWRRFAHPSQPDGILIAKSTNRGQRFSKPVEVATLYPSYPPGPQSPFDQGTSEVSFRTNSYPTLAVDDTGVVYLAWSERRTDGISRILISTSTNGSVWNTPTPIDDGGKGHQFMPSLTFAAGKVMMTWYDQRHDIAQQVAGDDAFTDYIEDSQYRHTIDVRVAQADKGFYPVFSSSERVSRYLHMFDVDWSGNPIVDSEGYLILNQVQFNPPNYPLFMQGMVPFHGDYIDISPSPMFLPGNGGWSYNTQPSLSPLFHAVWTDNRDVRPPLDAQGEPDWWGDWTQYTPPNSVQEPGWESRAGCYPGQAGMRNQNVYTSSISQGVIVGTLGNTKPLDGLGETPDGTRIPRSFTIFVKNVTDIDNSFKLWIEAPSGIFASFKQFEPLDELIVDIAAYSSVSLPVFVNHIEPSTNLHETVKVHVEEVGGILSETVLLNPDSTNPPIINPSGWDPEAPNIRSYEIFNPNIRSLSITNLDDSAGAIILNPNIRSTNFVNADTVNPNIRSNTINPNIRSPNIRSPNIRSWSLSDVTWTVENEGNTTASYTFFINTDYESPDPDEIPAEEAIQFQLLVYRVYTTPVDSACELDEEEHHELMVNISNPNIRSPNIRSVDILDPNIRSASFALPPGEEAIIVLRVFDPNITNNDEFDPGTIEDPNVEAGVASLAVNTEDAQEGIYDPPVSATTPLKIMTSSLDNATLGKPYSQTLNAFGENPPFAWSVIMGYLPYGLDMNSSTGEINGTPTATGTFDFTVQVADSSSPAPETASKELSITVVAPDLIVESLTHSPENPTTADTITFTAVVKNIGNSSAGASTLEFRIGGETPGAHETLFSVPALGPGEIHMVTRTAALTAGSYINTATADVNNVVIESDENNNITTDSFTVVAPHTISMPNRPSGPTTGFTGASYTYNTGGSVCSLGDTVEYRFDWGDDSQSTWSSSPSASHSWTSAGTYYVAAQARCSADTGVVSDWSDELTVTINEPIFEVVFIYSTDTTSASSFQTTLAEMGIRAELLHIDNINSFSFSGYSLVLIGNDTMANLPSGRYWGGILVTEDDSRIIRILETGLPVVGIGEGGAMFFNSKHLSLEIMWGNCWYDSTQTSINKVDSAHQIWNSPNFIVETPVQIYSAEGLRQEVFGDNIVSALKLAQCPSHTNYFPIAIEDRFLLWGFHLSPDYWTQTGKDLFENVVNWCAAIYYYKDSWDKSGDFAGWKQNTLWTILEVVDTGGNPGGYLSTKNSSGYPWAGACTEKTELTDNYSSASTVKISFDLNVFNGLEKISTIHLRFRYKHSGYNGWKYLFSNPSAMNVWNTNTVTFDPSWTDSEATASGWVKEDVSPSFSETMADVYTCEVRIQGKDGSTLILLGIDNFSRLDIK